MRAFLTVNKENIPNVKGSLVGYVMPYFTKVFGLPLFQFDTDEILFNPENQIDAVPGMVGTNIRGELFVVLGDESVIPTGGCIISDREYERYQYLQDSFTKEHA